MKTATAIIVAALLALPAWADDVEDSIEAALQAYRAGDIQSAREELDFAAQLLNQIKAQGLREFLPAPLEGWKRDDSEGDAHALGALGGGMMAGASYTRGAEVVEIQLMADNQMVTAMAGMFSSAALMGAMGNVQRIGGEKVVITPEGDLQAMIDNRIMVQVTGSADAEAKKAYFEAMDLEALEDF